MNRHVLYSIGAVLTVFSLTTSLAAQSAEDADNQPKLSAPREEPAARPVTPPAPENYGITEEAMAAARSNIMKAENSKLNPKITVNVDSGINYSYWGYSASKPVLKSGNAASPIRGAYDEGRIDFKMKLAYALRGGNMSMEFQYNQRPDNFSAPVFGLGIGYPSFSSALGGMPYNIRTGLGDLRYVVQNSPVDRPLLAGKLSTFDDLVQFNSTFVRVPWVEVKDPEVMYRGLNDSFAEIPEMKPDSFGLSKAGVGIEFKTPGDFNVGLMAVKYAFHPLVGVTKTIGKMTLGAGYFLSTDDPDWSGRPIYQGQTFDGSLVFNGSRASLFLEGAYTKSLIREYNATNFEFRNTTSDNLTSTSPSRAGIRETHDFGYSAHATLVTKKGKFLMLNGNQFFLRYLYASDGFDPTDNAARDVNFKFDSVIKPVDYLRNVDDFYTGAQTVFVSDRFNFLKGKVRVTGGLAMSSLATPDAYRLGNWFNHKVWHFSGAIYASDWIAPADTGTKFKTDYKSLWQQDWNDVYEGSSQVVWNHDLYVMYYTNGTTRMSNDNYRVPYYSKKNFSMFSVDYALDLSRIFKISFPVYYQGRIQYSAIFVNNALAAPFKASQANMPVHYSLFGNYFVFAVKKNFNLLAYIGVEQNRHKPTVTTLRQPVWYPGPGDKTSVKYVKRSSQALEINQKDVGYGGGFDWYFRDGFGFYFRFHTSDRQDYIQNYKSHPYGVRFELRRFFSYS
jgi:hypothetical protein